jgi:hypothetical protein
MQNSGFILAPRGAEETKILIKQRNDRCIMDDFSKLDVANHEVIFKARRKQSKPAT